MFLHLALEMWQLRPAQREIRRVPAEEPRSRFGQPTLLGSLNPRRLQKVVQPCWRLQLLCFQQGWGQVYPQVRGWSTETRRIWSKICLWVKELWEAKEQYCSRYATWSKTWGNLVGGTAHLCSWHWDPPTNCSDYCFRLSEVTWYIIYEISICNWHQFWRRKKQQKQEVHLRSVPKNVSLERRKSNLAKSTPVKVKLS